MWTEPGAALSHCGSSEPVTWEPPKLSIKPCVDPSPDLQTEVWEADIFNHFLDKQWVGAVAALGMEVWGLHS